MKLVLIFLSINIIQNIIRKIEIQLQNNITKTKSSSYICVLYKDKKYIHTRQGFDIMRMCKIALQKRASAEI